MAKLRVYELARDLGMKNKALLEKITEMKIVVSSHMSSLEDDDIVKIRAYVLGQKKARSDEDGQNRSTVIRRRRRRRDTEHHPEPAAPEAQAGDSGFHESAPSETDTSGHHPANTVSSGTGTEDAGPARKSKKRKRKKTKEEFKARIISPPPAVVSAEKAVGKPSVSDDHAAAPEHKESAAISSSDDTDVTYSPSDMTETEPVSVDDSQPGEAHSSPSGNVAVSPAGTTLPEEDKNTGDGSESDTETRSGKKKKRKKKGKKERDTPAKIIKPAPKPIETPPEEIMQEKAYSKVQVKEADPLVDAEDTAKSKKKAVGRKKGTPEVVSDEKESRWAKKKISFKRKEVIEGSDLYEEGGRGRKGKRGKAKPPKPQKTQITTPKAIKRRVKVDETIVLSDLAKRMGIKASEMIKRLMMMDVMVTVNQTIDFDTAVIVASEFGYEVENASFEEETLLNVGVTADDPEKMLERPPVVTIMGHVDHGKTSLLDVIRKTRVTEVEAGGITQHIGAYSVRTPGGKMITFLDTPGHEAFTAMRSRGATVTDIVVLVVAADDGVMPQTVEAINHARVARVPIIVAINKMDKPGADPDRVTRELADQGLMQESWGGDTIFVQVSAKKNQNIDELLEMILLQAEVLELRANAEKHAKGYVVESKLDSGRGPVATILIQEGTLRTGDPVVCGIHYGKIRAMLNDRGQQVDSAGPSEPVEILGLSGVPNAGDEMVVLEDDKSAKQVSEYRGQKQRGKELAMTSRMSLEKLFEKMKKGEVKDLNVILKADVHGSIEALRDSLIKLSNDEVNIRVIHAATGTVTESDVSLATVSNAIIIGFNVRPSAKIQAMANEEHVDMRFYNIIYNVIKDVKDAILGMMESTYEERVLGQAEVRQVFHVPKVGAVAGCYVTDGQIQRGKRIRLLRDGVIVHEGNISSLKRFKDDVKEVLTSYECGIGIENFNDIKVGDIIECYYLEEIKPALS